MALDRLRSMQVFVRVVETGGLRKAAETLSLPPSAVTATIQKLETYLEVKLLNRTTRSIALTADGEAYFERCQRILAEIEETEAALRNDRKRPRGKLRIDMPGSIGTDLVIPRLRDFTDIYPEIELAIGLSDRLVDLIQDGVDCVIRTGELQDSSLVARRIGTYQWLTCAAPAYLERYGEPRDVGALDRHRSVGYFSSRTGRIEPWIFTADGVATPIAVPSSVSVNETSGYLALGLEGFGLIRLADYIVEPHLRSGRLREVLREARPAPVPISILYPPTRHLAGPVRAFVDWASALFAERLHEPMGADIT